MELAAITAIVTGIQAALGLAKTTSELSNESLTGQERRQLVAVLNEVSSKLLELQTEHFKLVIENFELNKTIQELNSKTAAEESYEMVHLGGKDQGDVVYQLKEGTSGKVPHFCCPRCKAEKGIFLVLQFYDNNEMVCTSCKVFYSKKNIDRAGIISASLAKRDDPFY